MKCCETLGDYDDDDGDNDDCDDDDAHLNWFQSPSGKKVLGH